MFKNYIINWSVICLKIALHKINDTKYEWLRCFQIQLERKLKHFLPAFSFVNQYNNEKLFHNVNLVCISRHLQGALPLQVENY